MGKIDGKLAGMITRKITQHQGSERNTTYQESSSSRKVTAQRIRTRTVKRQKLPNAEYKKLKESNKLEGKIIEKVFKDDGCEYNTIEYGSGTENDDESCEDI